MFSRVSADRRSLHGQQQLAVAQSAEKAAAEELESALQSLTALRKLRPAGLAQHLPQLVSTLSHVRWPVRECAMELLAKCPPAALAPAVPALLRCVVAPQPGPVSHGARAWVDYCVEVGAQKACHAAAMKMLAQKKLPIDTSSLAPHLTALRQLLRDRVRSDAALEILCKLETDALISLLHDLLSDIEPDRAERWRPHTAQFPVDRFFKERQSLLRHTAQVVRLLSALPSAVPTAARALAVHLPMAMRLMEVCHTASYESLAESEKIVKNAEESFAEPMSFQYTADELSHARQQNIAHAVARTEPYRSQAAEMGEACAAAARLLCQLPEEAARCSPATSRPLYGDALLSMIDSHAPCARAAALDALALVPAALAPHVRRLTPRLADDSAPVRKAARRAASAVVHAAIERGDRDELARVADALSELFHGGGDDDGGDKKTRQRWKAAHSFAEAALQQLLAPPPLADADDAAEAGGSVLYRAARDEFAEASGALPTASTTVSAAPPAVRRGASVRGAGLPPHVAQQLGALEERMVRIWHRRLAEQTQEPSAADDGMLAPRRVRSV